MSSPPSNVGSTMLQGEAAKHAMANSDEDARKYFATAIEAREHDTQEEPPVEDQIVAGDEPGVEEQGGDNKASEIDDALVRDDPDQAATSANAGTEAATEEPDAASPESNPREKTPKNRDSPAEVGPRSHHR